MAVSVGPPPAHMRIYARPQSASGPAPRSRPALTSSLHHLVELALDVQLRVLRFHTLELDGNFFTRGNIGTCQGRGRAQRTWVTLGQAAGLTSGPSQTSVPEQLSTPWGTTEERQRALHCIQGKWRDCGHRADPWANWGGRAGWEERMCKGKARRNCGHVTEPQAGAARMSDVKGGEMGCRRLTDHGRGILPWRVGAPELERSEVSGMSGLRRREGSGASFCLKKSQERPKPKLCLASVSPALILSGLS